MVGWLMQRVCQQCASEFEFVYAGRGRPRAFCLRCVPEGTRRIGKKKGTKNGLSQNTVAA
jgi:hypothetical protein